MSDTYGVEDQANQAQWRRHHIIMAIFLLYVILLVTVDVGFIILAHQTDVNTQVANKTYDPLAHTNRYLLGFKMGKHVFQAPHQERSTFKENYEMQDSGQKKEATTYGWWWHAQRALGMLP